MQSAPSTLIFFNVFLAYILRKSDFPSILQENCLPDPKFHMKISKFLESADALFKRIHFHFLNNFGTFGPRKGSDVKCGFVLRKYNRPTTLIGFEIPVPATVKSHSSFLWNVSYR